MARIYSLLSQFGLEERLVTSSDSAIRVANIPINWRKVNTCLAELRVRSLNFLVTALRLKQE